MPMSQPTIPLFIGTSLRYPPAGFHHTASVPALQWLVMQVANPSQHFLAIRLIKRHIIVAIASAYAVASRGNAGLVKTPFRTPNRGGRRGRGVIGVGRLS